MRMKTEEEFIKDYGRGWRNVVLYGWNEDMNALFGKEFSKTDEKNLLSSGIFEASARGHNYSISISMVTDIDKFELFKAQYEGSLCIE